MENFTFKIEKTIKIPTTANDWQLYTASMNCDKAARALTSALKKAVKMIAINKNFSETMKLCMDPVMKKYSKYGACDSEPYWLVERILMKIFDEKYSNLGIKY